MPVEAQLNLSVNALDTAVKYANDVLSGTVIAGELVKRAVKRFLEDLECSYILQSNGEMIAPFREVPGRPPLYFSEDAANKVVKFFHRYLKHSKGTWENELGKQAFKLEAWQIFVLANIFGWYKIETNTRRYTEAYIEVARKNGKTTLLSGIGLYMLYMDGEAGASVCCAATKEDQARECFDEAVNMVKASPDLASEIQIRGGNYVKRLFVDASKSKYEPVSSEDQKLDGRNDSCVILDELHAHVSRDLYDVLHDGTASRKQPLTFAITTAGFNKSETSICFEIRGRIIKILLGILSNTDDGWSSDNVFGYIASLDGYDGIIKDQPKDNYFDEVNWPKANPSLVAGVVDIYRLREKANTAKNMPSALNDFLTKRMNVWTTQETCVIDPDKWKECCAAGPNSDKLKLREAAIEKLKGRRCFGGMDLSENIDLTSFYLVFPPVPDDPKWSILGWNWIPEDTIAERTRKDHVPYETWHRQGFLKATDGKVVDLDFIESWILKQREVFKIVEVGYDPYRALEITVHLNQSGLTMVKVPQRTEFFHEPLKKLFALIITKELEHFGDPILAWAASNLALFTDTNGNQKPDKNKAKEKIDPIVASLMGISRALATPGAANNPYDSRGIIFI